MKTSNIKIFLVIAMIFLIAHDAREQSFVIGEPQGTLNKIIADYKQAEQIGDSVIIDVEFKQADDTAVFCVGEFKDAVDIFLCLPGAVYKHGNNYVFVKTGVERYISYNEAYIRFIYTLASRFTRLNIKITSYSPFDTENTDKVIPVVGGDDYILYWYYVVNYNVVKTVKTDRDLYSTCWYGGE